ncbi:threonine/serine ThrE exporter family protein [Pengzhenrongella frigida]|uniref:threonine/serine ThrE exporter family protein n=1 Tax=Pengzhenrongella frigida TaxID=1259133 RepID=UPI001F5D49C2|nr:threonine/serine exporter family protein [Cellulomonas sp. HLT2-17]
MTAQPPAEETLEPVELIRQSGVVLRTGQLMLSAGTGSYRVKNAMQRVALALGLDRHHAHVTLTEITATSHRGSIFRTEVTEVRSIGVNSDRLAELERLTRALPPKVTVDEVSAELDRIERKPPLYRPLLNALWSSIACGAFAFLNNGGPVEILGVLVGAGLGQYVRRAFAHRRYNQFGAAMVAAAVACLGYLAFILGLEALGVVDPRHEIGYVSAVLFLIPGFPLVTAALDLAKLDFSAGVARLTYALMILTSAALSVWAVSSLAGLSPDPVEPIVLAPVAMIALQALASFLGVLGFALMFNSPAKMALTAASIGMVANVVRIQLVDVGAAPQAGAAAAALSVGLMAAWLAPRMHVPRITVSVPAVVIMVPGAAAYRAVFFLNNGDMTQAISYGLQAGLVVVAIAIGLAGARMLTDRAWAFER